MHHHDAWTPAFDPAGPLWAWLFDHTLGDWTIDRVAVPDPPPKEDGNADDDGPHHFRAGFDEHGFELDGDLDDPNYEHATNSVV